MAGEHRDLVGYNKSWAQEQFGNYCVCSTSVCLDPSMLLILVIISATHFGVAFPRYDPFYYLKASSATQPVVPKYTYLVRIINPEQRSRFVTKIWHHVRDRFNSLDLLKLRLIETFEDKLPPLSELELGYLEKKTNAKRWIEDRDDLEAYQAFSSGDEITLWCDARHAPEE